MSVLSNYLDYQPPDNSVVQRRLAAKQQRSGSLPGALGDYAAELPNRILVTQGNQQKGPVTSPTIAPPQPTDTTSLLIAIRDLLQRMPVSLSDEFRTRFIVQPRETVSFVTPGTTVTVPAGGSIAVATQKLGQNYCGFLTHVGVFAAAGQLPFLTWQIRVNGAIHPYFSNRIFTVPTIGNPNPFAAELVQASTVSLVVLNSSGAPIDVSGILIGWTEFMSSYKRYGASPQSAVG